MGRKRIPSDVKFWKRVKKSENCWEWIGSKIAQGYGTFSTGGVWYRAHRYSWIMHNGQIPDGLCVLHKCDNPGCVRPDHLFLGTFQDNTDDCISKGRFKGRSRIEIEIGKEYGYATVLEITSPGHSCRCLCKCGTEFTARANSIASGHTRSCGCYNKERLSQVHTGHTYNLGRPASNKLDRAGKRYGRLTALKDEGNGRWLCRCDCGNCYSVLSTNLANMAKNNRGCSKCISKRS